MTGYPPMRHRTIKLLIVTVVAGFLSIVAAAPASAAVTTVGDATASGSGCTWTIATSKVSKTLTFSSGTYELTSFQNISAGREYIQGGTVSPEFSFSWDGTTLTGASGGWTCASGTVTTPTVDGNQIIQLAVALTRSTVEVTKYYQVFPMESVIREWTAYTNTDTAGHTLADPTYADAHMMTSDIAAGHVQLQYMLGAACCNGFSYNQESTTLTTTYARNFDSYDPLDCVDSGSTPSTCTPGGWKETSSSYIPWFNYVNTSTHDGVMATFDYMGRWQMQLGNLGGGGSVSGFMPNYNSAVTAGTTVTGPVATVMTYTTDEDTMTNDLLDYQYRYLWDETNSAYFAKVAAPADWCTGTQWCSQWDQQGVRQKIYGLADLDEAAGNDVDWRDNGWWDTPGSWNGPDFELTNNTLNRLGARSIVYYPAYDANAGSAVYTSNPSWFPTGSPCGYAQYLGDLSIPAFQTWMQNLLEGNTQKWGGYEFRNDSCPVGDTTGAKQLAADQAYRSIIGNFIGYNAGNAYYSVDSGGNEIGLDTMRMSSAAQFYDQPGIEGVGSSQDQFYNASRLFPVDKISGDPNTWDAGGYCTQQVWADLAMNPSYFSSAVPQQTWHADTTDSQQIECARELSDTYHYMVAQGVAGRWTKQYHPSSSDAGTNWFERTDAVGTQAVISRIGGSTGSAVTVYPSGLTLNPTTNYDVEFQFTAGTRTMTGAQINAGITLTGGAVQGETIYINLPGRPGAHNDTTAPSPPSAVKAVASTDVNYPDVIVSWTVATDNTWVSYYNVYRDNVYVGRSTRTTYLDHTPDATPDAVYSVQAVDGAGNMSTGANSSPPHGQDGYGVDDATPALISYTGSWTHHTGVDGASHGTLSTATTSAASANYTFTGSSVTLYAPMGPDEGTVQVSVDATATTLDLYAPDALNDAIPIFTRDFSTNGTHTITITPTGSANAKSTGTAVPVDGLRITDVAPATTDDASFSYSSGWTSSCSGCDAIGGTLHSSATTGTTATFTVNSSRIRLVGNYCSSCGEADIKVDGTFDSRIDTYGDRGAAQTHAVLFDKSWPTSGSHTVTVTVDGTHNLDASGSTVTLDAVLADPGSSAPATSSAYQQQVVSDAPDGLWRLDDAVGSGTAVDSSVNADSGTVHGTVTFATAGAVASAPTDTSATFDGTSGFVDLGNPSALQTSNGTVSAWIKTTNTDSTYHAVAIKWYAYSLFVHNGHLVTYDWSTNTEHDTGVTVADGAWHQVAISYQSGVTNGTKLYVDGVQAGSATTITVANQANDALIGSGDTTGVEYFGGAIDEVAFYPSALSAGRIAAQYAGASYAAGVLFNSAAGYWRLGDPVGSSTAADATIAAASGTVHGGVTFGQPGALPSDPSHTSAAFDGSSGFVDLGNPASLQSNDGAVSAWIKTTSTDSGFHAIAIKWYAYGLFVQGGHLVTYDWSTAAVRDTGVNVADGVWHQVVLSYQSGVTGGTVLYVDGHQVGSATTITTQNQGGDALIGSGSTTGVEYFAGDISDVAFSAAPLTAAQVLHDYDGGQL